jgi:hypothetical protein
VFVRWKYDSCFQQAMCTEKSGQPLKRIVNEPFLVWRDAQFWFGNAEHGEAL